MTTDITTGGVVNFMDMKKKLQEKKNAFPAVIEEHEISNIDNINTGLAAFAESLDPDTTNGIITIVFDKSDMPTVVVAGEMDPFKAIGVLEYCKTELSNNMIYQNYNEMFESEDLLAALLETTDPEDE